MVIAAVRDTPYNIVLILHLVAVVAAFAPAIAHPVMAAQAKRLDPTARNQVYGFLAANSMRIYGTALIVVGLLGFALSGMSGGAYPFSQTWVWLAAVLWVLMIGLLHGLLVPAERALAAGDSGAEQRISIGGAVLTVASLVMLYLMVFKPGVA